MLNPIRRWLRRRLRLNSSVLHLRPYLDPRFHRGHTGLSMPPERTEQYWQQEFEKKLAANLTERRRRERMADWDWYDLPMTLGLQAD